MYWYLQARSTGRNLFIEATAFMGTIACNSGFNCCSNGNTVYKVCSLVTAENKSVLEMIYHSFNLFMPEVAVIAQKYRGNDKQGMTRREDIYSAF